jgi:phosphatidylglycerophosphate synthase
VAGIASHGRPLAPGRGAGPSAAFFDYVATTLVLFAAAVVVVVAWVMRGDRAGGGPPRRGKWNFLSQMVIVGGAILLAELLMHSKFEQRIRNLGRPLPGQQQQVPPTTAPKTPTDLRNAQLRWDEIAIVLAIVLAVGAYFWFTRPARKPLRELARRRDRLSRALDDSLDDLRNDPDVRRAIIAAYARMERALGAAGVPRRAAEAPFEYLSRALVELDASRDAAEHLTDLFERAKFSHHQLGEPMRNEAIDALVAVRADLVPA